MSKPNWCLLTIVAVLSAVLVGVPAAADPDTPIGDPIPDNPVQSRLALTLTEYAAFPKTEAVPPPTDPRLQRHARINYLGELPDGSGRTFVPDMNGMLYLVKRGTPRPYLDVGAAVGPDFWSHRGLGSGFGFVEFHPDFKRNGLFYTVHTEARDALLTKVPDLPPQRDAQVHGVVTEWTAANPVADTFTGTRREVLRLGFRTFIHGFQQIGFNPTAGRHDDDRGLLYIAVGDGGAGVSGTDPQNVGTPYGKILRIDPRGTDGANGRYGIPRTNPFVGQAGARGEVYAIGMRDPYRFSWDPRATWDTSGPGWPRLRHRMYLGHIGEHNIEAIVDVKPGDNFGWSKREGSFVVKPSDPLCGAYPLPADDAQFGYTYPLAAYDHERVPGAPACGDHGYAVMGGFVYRGHAVPALYGRYVFGEGVRGNIFFTNTHEMRRGEKRAPIHEFALLDRTGKRVTMAELAGDARVDLRFGTDNRGELYVLSKANGKVWKVTGARWLRP